MASVMRCSWLAWALLETSSDRLELEIDDDRDGSEKRPLEMTGNLFAARLPWEAVKKGECPCDEVVGFKWCQDDELMDERIWTQQGLQLVASGKLPLNPFVSVSAGVDATAVWSGQITEESIKVVELGLTGTLTWKLSPFALSLKVRGSFCQTSMSEADFRDVIRYGMDAHLQAFYKDNPEYLDGTGESSYLAESERKIANLDPGFQTDDVSERYAWNLAMADRLALLYRSLANRVHEVHEQWRNFAEPMLPLEGIKEKDLTDQAVIQRVVDAIEQFRRAAPSGSDPQEQSFWSDRLAAAQNFMRRNVWSRETLVAELRKVLREVTEYGQSRAVLQLAELTVNSFFDPSWNSSDSFSCSEVPKTASISLARCPRSNDWGCYPELHDGRTVLQTADANDSHFLAWSNNDLQVQVPARLLCELLEGFTATATSASHDHVDYLQYCEWRSHETSVEGKQLPYAALSLASGIFTTLALATNPLFFMDFDPMKPTDKTGCPDFSTSFTVDQYLTQIHDIDRTLHALNDPTFPEVAHDFLRGPSIAMFDANFANQSACKETDEASLRTCNEAVKGWLLDFATRESMIKGLQSSLEPVRSKLENKTRLARRGQPLWINSVLEMGVSGDFLSLAKIDTTAHRKWVQTMRVVSEDEGAKFPATKGKIVVPGSVGSHIWWFNPSVSLTLLGIVGVTYECVSTITPEHFDRRAITGWSDHFYAIGGFKHSFIFKLPLMLELMDMDEVVRKIASSYLTELGETIYDATWDLLEQHRCLFDPRNDHVGPSLQERLETAGSRLAALVSSEKMAALGFSANVVLLGKAVGVSMGAELALTLRAYEDKSKPIGVAADIKSSLQASHTWGVSKVLPTEPHLMPTASIKKYTKADITGLHLLSLCQAQHKDSNLSAPDSKSEEMMGGLVKVGPAKHVPSNWNVVRDQMSPRKN